MSLDAAPRPASTPAAESTLSSAIEPPVTASGSRSLWIRLLIGLVVIGGLAGATPFIVAALSPEETGPKLTHKVTTGDLDVSIIEQGTLESSSNTEIKCKVRGSATVLWVIETGTSVEPGDELVKLDPSAIEDAINQQEIAYQRALATFTTSETNVAVAKIAIREYEEGTFKQQLKALQKDLAIAESNLRTTKNLLEHSQRMFKRGYASQLEVEGNQFSLKQAQLELELKESEITVLKEFTKAKELETLQSTLKSAEATLASDKAALDLEKARLDREKQQLKNCVITAPAAGMVIHPSAAEWKSAPDIEVGATVRQDQILLLIPDLSQMQVKVGIHESKVDRLKVGMDARVTLLNERLNGKVAEIATVTKPAGWWTGNVVKYDTIVELEAKDGVTLKPGMSVEVKVILAEHRDALTVPVAAVVEHDDEFSCWVKTPSGLQRQEIQIGDSNDEFMVVKDGLSEGDEVVINPRKHVDEAKEEALKPGSPSGEADSEETGAVAKPTRDANSSKEPKSSQESKSTDTSRKKERTGGTESAEKKPAVATVGQIVAQTIKQQDKDGDGKLSIDEFAEEHRAHFDLIDTDGDGFVSRAELTPAIQRAIDDAKAKQKD